MKTLHLALLLILLFTSAAFAALDLNSATKEQLDSLPGIGPVKAEAIINYRKEKGSFKSVDELKEVSGIGEKIFQSIKNEVTVGAAPAGSKPAEAATPAVKAEAEAKPPEAAAKEEKKEEASAETKK